MVELLRRLMMPFLASIGTVWVGLWGRFEADLEPWRLIAGITLGVFLLILGIWDAVDFFAKKPKRYKNKIKIRRYMKSWLSRPGRVAMVTRDLSWADEGILERLRSKAREGDLRLYTHPSNPHARELEEEKAEIFWFPEHFSSRVPFTITGYGKLNERIALAIPGNPHTIAEFDAGSVEIELAKNFLKLVENENRPTDT